MNRAAMTAAGMIFVATIAHAQPSPEPPRRGGLLPGRSADPAGTFRSRDEMARRWDLNADGTIDEAEAEVARAKMRREKAELMQRSQISPLAKPADDTAAALPEAEETLQFPDPAAPPPKPAAKTNAATTENRRVEEPASPKTAPSIRDLNAGRLPAGLPPARGIAPGTPPPGRIGSATANQPPPSTMMGGRRLGPTVPPATRSTRLPPATRPATPLPTRPRVTADEMGGP